MARLYDHIMAGQAIYPGRPIIPSRHPDMLSAMSGATVIAADNVVEMTMKERKGWDPAHDYPNIAPPLERFWIEARRPKSGMEWADYSDEDQVADLVSWGALVESVSPEDVYEDHSPHDETIIAKARWALRIILFMELRRRGQRAVIGPTGTMMVPVAGDGSALGYSYVSALNPGSVSPDGNGYLKAKLELDHMASTFDTEAAHLVAPLFVAICFMHCKNVSTREVEQPAFDRQVWRKKHKRPLVRYRVLDIDPMRKVLKTAGRLEEVGLKKALHICRGHFATYTDEAPLFGRVTGTFWKPQHVRGNAKHGAVVKDYNVKAPRP